LVTLHVVYNSLKNSSQRFNNAIFIINDKPLPVADFCHFTFPHLLLIKLVNISQAAFLLNCIQLMQNLIRVVRLATREIGMVISHDRPISSEDISNYEVEFLDLPRLRLLDMVDDLLL